MVRDIDKFHSYDTLHLGQEKASHRPQYGNCTKLNKPVSFIPETCQIDTQQCFENRRNG
jgi:hypothetical protein